MRQWYECCRLKEIGWFPRLAPKEEIQLGRNVQHYIQLLNAKASLTEQLDREPTLEEWGNQLALPTVELQQAIEKGKSAKHRMVEASLWLVVLVAIAEKRRTIRLSIAMAHQLNKIHNKIQTAQHQLSQKSWTSAANALQLVRLSVRVISF